jgi:hypothetical protein
MIFYVTCYGISDLTGENVLFGDFDNADGVDVLVSF